MDIKRMKSFIIDSIKSNIYRIFNKPLLPRILAYNVTYRCNCRCSMCKINSKITKNSPDELNAYDIKRMFTDKILHNFRLVRFTGGEPFIKEDFIEIANIILDKSKTQIIYITTNGYFTERIVELLKNIKKYHNCLLHLQISLDGIGAIHDKMRNLDGLFDRVYNTLTALKELRKHYRFSVGISQVILKENLDQIKPVNNLAREFGFGHYLTPGLWPTESCLQIIDKDNSAHGMISNFSDDELNTILSWMRDIDKQQRNEGRTIVNLLRGVADRWYLDKFSSRTRIPKFICFALFIYFRLMPNGFIIPCIIRSDSRVANVRESNFSDIWSSEKAQEIRGEIKNCDGCWVWCDILPSFYYSGLFIVEYFKHYTT